METMSRIELSFKPSKDGMECQSEIKNCNPKMIVAGVQLLIESIVDDYAMTSQLEDVSYVEKLEYTYDSLKELHLVSNLMEHNGEQDKKSMLYMLDKMRSQVEKM